MRRRWSRRCGVSDLSVRLILNLLAEWPLISENCVSYDRFLFLTCTFTLSVSQCQFHYSLFKFRPAALQHQSIYIIQFFLLVSLDVFYIFLSYMEVSLITFIRLLTYNFNCRRVLLDRSLSIYPYITIVVSFQRDLLHLRLSNNWILVDLILWAWNRSNEGGKGDWNLMQRRNKTWRESKNNPGTVLERLDTGIP